MVNTRPKGSSFYFNSTHSSGAGNSAGGRVYFDQQGQHIKQQINVAGNYYAAPQPVSVSPPYQLPPRADYFIGRSQELTRLVNDLQPGSVVTLCGPGGMGKTALAAEALVRLPEARFPDGIIFYCFYGQPSIDLACEHIVGSYIPDARDTSLLAVRRLLSRKQALLVLDGSEEVHNLSALLDSRGACGVLITSRSRKDALADRRDLKPLSPDEAIRLLCKWIGEQVMGEDVAVQICALVGYLPLAVRLIGRYLAQSGERAAEYLTWLESTPLDALSQGTHRQESVPLLLSKSIEQIKPEARDLLSVIGCLALAPFERAPLAEALGQKDNALHRPFAELVTYGLLTRNRDNDLEGEMDSVCPVTYTVSHALIHTYINQYLQPSEQVFLRLSEYYVTFTHEQQSFGIPGYHCLDSVRSHLLHILKNCISRQQWKLASELVWAVESYLYLRGYSSDLLNVLDSGLYAARQSHNRYDESIFLNWMGLAYNFLGDVEQAIECYMAALSIAREIGDQQGIADPLGNLGSAYVVLGKIEEAIGYYEQALVIAQEIGYQHGEGNYLGNLGVAYLTLGEVTQAIEYCKKALVIAQELGLRQKEGNWLGNLGHAYQALKDIETAIGYYKSALAIAQEVGDRQSEGALLTSIALIETAYKANDELSLSLLNQAIAIQTDTGDARGLAYTLLIRGSVEWVLHQDKTAKQTWQQSLAIAVDSGYKSLELVLNAFIAFIDGEEGYKEKAQEVLQISSQEWREMKLDPSFLNTVQSIMGCIEMGIFPK